jgi:hypothetical protein
VPLQVTLSVTNGRHERPGGVRQPTLGGPAVGRARPLPGGTPRRGSGASPREEDHRSRTRTDGPARARVVESDAPLESPDRDPRAGDADGSEDEILTTDGGRADPARRRSAVAPRGGGWPPRLNLAESVDPGRASRADRS